MKKHIYVHTSDLNKIDEFISDDNFLSVYDYPEKFLKKIYPNEFGWLETKNLYIHTVIGSLPLFKCPWCNSEPVLKQEDVEISMSYLSKYYFECPNCYSRGPLFVSTSLYHPDDNILKGRYGIRLPWDHDIINKEEK